jgi:TP901 family phage tail tape measure protein
MADVTKSVTIRWNNENMAVTTRQIESLSGKLRVVSSQVKNADGVWATTKQTTYANATAQSKLGAALNSTMLRFIGLNAVISMGSQAYQELRQFIDESVGAFRSFEMQMAEVSSILDSTTRDTLPSLEVGITQLSVKFGKSVGDMTKGLYDIVSAAFDVDDAMGLLEVATKAAIAGVTTTESAVKTLTGVLNAYGLSAAHAAQISDELFQSVIRGVYTFSDLESALGYVTPIAANVGVSLKEVLSAMSAATRQGQHLDSVTRGLGLLLQGIVSPTSQAADAAKKYGIDMSATALRVGGLEGFLRQLSEATAKYGQQILPELIGNMRSLRVALALTGETGLGGFTDDMNLMATATGRTDDAMAAMMDTQQKMSEIIEQSMAKVERIVGEKLSGIDLWWKKSMVYWAAEFAKPFAGAGNKAVADIDKAFSDIRQSYINNLINPAATGEKTILDKLSSGESVKTALPLEVMLRYNVNAESYVGLQKISTDAQNAKKILEQIHIGPDIIPTSENLTMFNELLGAIGLADKELKVGNSDAVVYQRTMDAVNGVIDRTNGSLETLFNTLSTDRTTVDQIKSAFDDMKSAISDSNITIIEINSEIATLNEQLNVKYKGKDNILEYGFAVKEATNQLERFAEYSQMAASQGPEYLNEFTNQTDKYRNSLNSVLTTIYEYNEAMEEQKKVTKEAEKANRDLEIQMAQNNIKMLQYQLIGMIRRRGNTRAEQRAMKQIEIENTKLRIEQMKNQYAADVANNDSTNDAKQTAYEKAQEILSNYTEFEQHELWLLQDTRDEDLQDLRDNINDQWALLKTKTDNLRTENAKLLNEYTLYGNSLRDVADDPVLAESFKKITGISAMEEAMKLKPIFDAFMAGKPILPETKKVTQTGSAVIDKKALVDKIPNMAQSVKNLLLRGTRGYESGTDYVPSTGLYQLHKGEAVVPAGKNSGGSPIIININNPVVNNPNDISKLAQALENVVRANLTDKQTGKSKYRMA